MDTIGGTEEPEAATHCFKLSFDLTLRTSGQRLGTSHIISYLLPIKTSRAGDQQGQSTRSIRGYVT